MTTKFSFRSSIFLAPMFRFTPLHIHALMFLGWKCGVCTCKISMMIKLVSILNIKYVINDYTYMLMRFPIDITRRRTLLDYSL